VRARRLDLPTLRAALWTLRASHQVRRRLRRDQLDVALADLPPLPSLPDHAERGVTAVLARRGDTCLVRAIVRQRWDAAHGRPRELVIGVAPRGGGDLRAHAWLEGEPPHPGEDFRELLRRPAPSR
jgi:Transglutaminase-like superfamily